MAAYKVRQPVILVTAVQVQTIDPPTFSPDEPWTAQGIAKRFGRGAIRVEGDQLMVGLADGPAPANVTDWIVRLEAEGGPYWSVLPNADFNADYEPV